MVDLEKIKKIIADHENRLRKLEGTNVGKKSKSSETPQKKSSITEHLLELKSDGFFKQPRLLKDIVNELARRGYHYRPTSLTEPLQRSVRKNNLGRIGKSGQWKYVNR